MNTIKIKYFLDIVMGAAFIAVAVTGIMKFPGLFRALGLSYRGLPMANLSILHDWAGITMAVCVFLHIILNWDWIICVTKSLFKKGDKTCKK